MSDRVEIPCPGCGRALRVRPEYFGLQIVCKYCATDFIAHAPPAVPHVVSWPEAAEASTLVASDDRLRGELAALRNLVDEAQRERQELRASIAALRNEMDRRLNEFMNARANINQAVGLNSIADLRRQVESLTAELAEARVDTDRVRATLDELGIRMLP